ncbi:30S ribosomal protein S15 [Candidatus Micrarchaeota archaeon]|nr:30S ribosomal protein S15 [Candidatus Micrarchaeota archaeon]
MAKLHSKKKGKSGTKRPKSKTAPEWDTADKAKIEELVIKMAKEGVQSAKIGLILRDQHAVPNIRAVLGLSLSAFLKKEGVTQEYPDDLLDLIKKAVRLSNHMKTFKKDVHNKVKLTHIESKIGRLVRYYTKTGALPKDWKYNREKAALLVK